MSKISLHCIHYQIGNFLKGKLCIEKSGFFSFKNSSLSVWENNISIFGDLL